MTDVPNAAAKAKRQRSPAYPGINLQNAIKRATEFYDAERRNPASYKAAVSHWGYSEKSSGALVTAAALKSFGLLDELESSVGRTFRLSTLGLKIVADKRPESPERDAAIREAALKPKIHAEIWRKYNGRLPSDAELQFRLENEWHFNTNSIGPFIMLLRETIAFAKLTESDKIEDVEVRDDDTEENGEEDGGKSRNVPNQGPSSKNYMLEYVVPLSAGSKAVFQWPSDLTQEDVEDLKDSLKFLERKIARSAEAPKPVIEN